MTTNNKKVDMDKIFKNAIDKYGTCAALIEKFDSEFAFAILNKCKCCERHQQNRPKKFEIWNKNNEQQDPLLKIKSKELQISQVNACGCDCRHLSRWLCRGVTTDILCQQTMN